MSSAIKAARFVRFCDCFQHPHRDLRRRARVSAGDRQEYGGIIKHGAKLLYAYAEATVPKVTVITRKAYGGAYDVMSSKHLRGDVNFAWPSAEIAVMGPKGAVEIIFRQGSRTTKRRSPAHTPRSTGRSSRTRLSPVSRGYIDDVIMPRTTRQRICRSLAMLENKDALENPWRKHENLPLSCQIDRRITPCSRRYLSLTAVRLPAASCRTARRMGIATVAVYSEADRGQPCMWTWPTRPCASVRRHRPRAIWSIEQASSKPAARRAATLCIRVTGSCPRMPPSHEALAAPGSPLSGRRWRAVEAMGDKITSKRIAEEAGVSTAYRVIWRHSSDGKEAVKVAARISDIR